MKRFITISDIDLGEFKFVRVNCENINMTP